MKWIKAVWCFIIGIFGISCTKDNPVEELPYIPVDVIYKMTTEEMYLFDHVNVIRLEKGLNLLKSDKLNYEVAEQRNLRNFKQDTITHDGFVDDMMRLTNAGLTAGENLAFKYSSVETALKAFENSPDHLENMLNPRWEFTGIRIMRKEETGDMYYTQVFSRNR